MPVEFRDIYSVRHFINITDKLCARLTEAFPAALTSSGRGEKHTVLSPVHQAFKLCPNCVQNAAWCFWPRDLPTRFSELFIYFAARFEGEPQHIADHVPLVCMSPWKCPYMCRWDGG